MKTLNTIVIVTVLLLLAVGGFLYYNQTRQGNTINPLASPTPTRVVQQPTPTIVQDDNADDIDLTGEVTEVTGRVGYKNAIAVKVDNTNVYITADTEITDENNKVLSNAAVRTGTTVTVVGRAAEGGIEATSLTVLSATTPSPTGISPTPRE